MDAKVKREYKKKMKLVKSATEKRKIKKEMKSKKVIKKPKLKKEIKSVDEPMTRPKTLKRKK